MSFAQKFREESIYTQTENGALALNTTSDARLDLFSTIGSLRQASEERIITLFAEAYKVDTLFATKILFYARDIREGLGERRTFKTLLKYLAEYHPEAIIPNLDLIGVYGRYDDLYCLIDTPVESEMWETMKNQFVEDYQNYQNLFLLYLHCFLLLSLTLRFDRHFELIFLYVFYPLIHN